MHVLPAQGVGVPIDEYKQQDAVIVHFKAVYTLEENPCCTGFPYVVYFNGNPETLFGGGCPIRLQQR